MKRRVHEDICTLASGGRLAGLYRKQYVCVVLSVAVVHFWS